uniref:B cell scaffold protein with ankyrin repeats 1 n=1 Tax=Jaculus jaculus TaxID=51337 RepID=A0A8C5L039_JACJA
MLPAAPARRLGPSGPARLGSEEYLEVSIPMDQRVKHSGKGTVRKEIGNLEASSPARPLVVVFPAEVSCQNPGEIFILLKDEVSGETLEVEFISDNSHIRTQPAYWSKNVWSMKALDFPAGSIIVNVYCDGVMKATTEIKYCTKATGCPVRVPDPRDVSSQNNLEELDGVLASMFKLELPYCGFRSPQTEVYCQNQTHVKELPTLLHCTAKLGLRRLAAHLLQCSGAAWAAKVKSIDGLDLAHVAERHGHRELKKIFEDFTSQEIGRNNEQENDSEEDIDAFYTFSPSTQFPTFHHEKSKTHRLSTDGAEQSERARETKQNESSAKATLSPPEIDSRCPEDQYDDLYVFLPGTDSKNNPQGSLVCCRPPLPAPRSVSGAFQLERPRFSLQGKIVKDQMERSQKWIDSHIRHEPRDESSDIESKDEKDPEEEDPYTCAEADDHEYDLILTSMSVRKNTGGRSFILNRPPAPTPRPASVLPKEQAMPYIAQVFQQKAARRQSDSDTSYGVPKKPDKAQTESLVFSIPRDCLTSGQEELILLQEKVKNGKMSVDEALEKFKHWQMGKNGLEVIQQEKLRQLRDSIIGKRSEEENAYDKLTIVHHPSGNTTHSENMLYTIHCSNKLPARLQVEKELGFCYKKDH